MRVTSVAEQTLKIGILNQGFLYVKLLEIISFLEMLIHHGFNFQLQMC